MKNKEKIRNILIKIEFDMLHTNNYDNYKYLEEAYNSLKWVLGEVVEEKCVDCGVALIENGMPPDDSDNVRLMCPKCGKWKWKGEYKFDY